MFTHTQPPLPKEELNGCHGPRNTPTPNTVFSFFLERHSFVFFTKNFVVPQHYDLTSNAVFKAIHGWCHSLAQPITTTQNKNKHCFADWLLWPCDPKWRFPTVDNGWSGVCGFVMVRLHANIYDIYWQLGCFFGRFAQRLQKGFMCGEKHPSFSA